MVNQPQETRLSQDNSLSNPEAGLTYETTQATTGASLVKSDQFIFKRKRSAWTIVKLSLLGIVVLSIVSGLIFAFFQRHTIDKGLQASSFNEVRVPLKDTTKGTSSLGAQSLKVRGQLDVDSSLVLAPSGQPQNPISGQLYFDKERSQMLYYNGIQFTLLQGSSGATVNNISGDSVTNNVFSTTSENSITNIFNTSGGINLTGTAGNLAMFSGNSSLGNSLIQQSNTTLQVATAGTNTVTVGSSANNSSTTLQGGTGNVTVATGGSAGITGSISITTGNSSSTASGNITIDSGSGVIDGEIVEDKTFESGLADMQNWFNVSLATTTAQAHSGSQSLEVTPSSQFWGVIEVLPGTTVIPGHQYHFSIWVRASTTPRSIGASIVWQGAGTTTAFNSVVDSTTGWTEMTLTAPAPAGATSVSFRMQSSTGAAGEIHYFDDLVITDLSSGSAISAIDLGGTNAKIITIGNLNQIGATTIRGGSGINIQSGAAATVINGGSLSMVGNAASSLSTTSGSLTIASAATAIWGVSTAASGIGGDLTLRAGQGGSDGNNDGGDLVLQGGGRNGTGTPGSVIIRPTSDVADMFQLQNSAGVSFLTADTIDKKITITGTGGSFAILALNNAHFSSIQTTAPTISAPTDCGAAPTAALTAGSTDSAGSFSITTGSGGTAASCSSIISFNSAYASAPKTIIVTGKTDAASAARQIYVSSSSTATFTTAFGSSAAGANGVTYSFSYWVVE